MSEAFLNPAEVKTIWQQVCNQLQPQLSQAVFQTWIVLNPLTQVKLLDDEHAEATITAQTAFHASNLQRMLHSQLKGSLDAALARDTIVLFQVGMPVVSPPPVVADAGPAGAASSTAPTAAPAVSPAPSQPSSQPHSHALSSSPHSSQNNLRPLSNSLSPRVEDLFSPHSLQAAAMDRAILTARSAGLRPDYTFEKFAVSTTNEMAHAAATAVSNRPGVAYNPLFLYGGVGVGKTHLMHAIGNNILKNNPDTKILYCTGEEFTNEIVQAIQTKKALKFKEKYRNAQVLLIDDIQFIAGKNAVQEEFFHTFNALTQQAGQIVMTSDRPPHEINLLEDRLRSRFEAGLMIDIQQPSFELRTAILLIKAGPANLTIPMDIAQLIASRVDSARKIEGIITKLRSAVELQRKPISTELVESLLLTETDQQRTALKVSPSDVIRTVANHFHVKQSALKGQQRVAHLVKARHVAMYLLKEDLGLPLTEIARWFANRDHTSALHAVRKINQQLVKDELLQRDVSALRMSLTAVSR